MLRCSLLALLAVAAFLGAPTLAPAQQDQALITIDQARFDDAKKQWIVSGTAQLPEGSQVSGSISFSKVEIQWARGPMEKGKYQIAFEPSKKVLHPGKYLATVKCLPDDQPEELKAEVEAAAASLVASIEVGEGTPEAENVARKQNVERLLGFSQELRGYHLVSTERSAYLLLAVQNVKKQNGELSKADQDRYLISWTDFATRTWASSYPSVMAALQEYGGYFYAPYYPEAETHLRTAASNLGLLHYSTWKDLCTALGVPIPQKIVEQSGQFFERESMTAAMYEAVEKFYKGLGQEPVVWKPNDLSGIEEGVVEGNRYTSRFAQFSIERASEAWEFHVSTSDQTVRLRIRPKDPAVAERVYVQVEILDYPDANDVGDLKFLTEATAHERWTGYVTKGLKQIGVPDAKFKSGTRPGFDHDFLAEVNAVKYRLHTRNLCCASFKRMFVAVARTYPDEFVKFEKDLDKMLESFRVQSMLPAEK